MTWKPTDEDHTAARGWRIGDRVTARANEISVPTGSRGTVVGFSRIGGHPLVDFASSGLVLIRAEHLDDLDDADVSPPVARVPGTSGPSATPRLSATPRPPGGTAEPAPPVADWFARPAPPRAEEGDAAAPDHTDKERP